MANVKAAGANVSAHQEKKNTLESSDDETDIEMKRQYEKAKRQKKVAKERILTQLKDTLRKPLHSTPCRTNPLHSEEEVESETVDTNVDLFNYPGNSQSTRQKKVGKERVLTQLKDTLRKPLHSDPRRTNPLHSEEEVQAETVDTNVDLFDYPENFQPTDSLDAAEASGESVEQPLFVSGEVLKALKEIPTLVQCVKELISSMNRGIDTASTSSGSSSSAQEMISLGNMAVQVNKTCFRRLNRSRMSLFTQELAVLLFGREVLGSSSLTGNRSQKERLNPEKMNALIDTVISEFPGTSQSEKTTSAKQMGLKIPKVEQITSTAEQMKLRTTSVELLVQGTTKADQVGLEQRAHKITTFSAASLTVTMERALEQNQGLE